MGRDPIIRAGVAEDYDLTFTSLWGILRGEKPLWRLTVIIKSMLDTDTYKLSMQNAVLFGNQFGVSYANCGATYQFINRDDTPFPAGFAHALQLEVNAMADLQLTQKEYEWLRENCPFLKRAYLDYLRGYRFDPSEVIIDSSLGSLQITIRGPWYRTILWEVPLMAMISELYFKMKGLIPDDEWKTRCMEKALDLGENNAATACFATRRRFSYGVQDAEVLIMKNNCRSFVGASNVHFAMKHGLKPIGTHAHEWFSFHAALFGYRLANQLSLQAWVDEYKGDLGIALSDTFTTDVFMRDFGKLFAKLYDGMRQDSGDPFVFLEKAVSHYQLLGIDPMSKTIIFSDSLDVPKAIKLKNACDGRIKCAFGIGTNFSNDCGHKALNMVIKLVGVEYNGRLHRAVKLSDAFGKATGHPDEVALCKGVLGVL